MPAMAREDTVVGVAFAVDGVRLAAVQHTDAGVDVLGVHAYRWPAGAWDDGVITNATVVREGLRQAIADADFSCRDVALAIGGDVVHTVLELPRMTARELAEQIPWEAQQHVPGGVATRQLEYRVLSDDADLDLTRVQLTGFTTAAIESHLAVAREAGLRPRAVEVEAEALRRVAIAAGSTTDTGTIALLRVSTGDANVVVLSGGEVVATRQFQRSGTDDDTGVVARTLDRPAAADGGPVERVLVAGTDADHWIATLPAQVSAPVAALSLGPLNRNDRLENSELYATAIGLALPGPPTHTLGAPAPRRGLWSRLSRVFGGR